jgi:shikimate 5-dehydrogenase
LIHATPVGMHPETGRSLVPPHLLHNNLAVFDIVYNPLKTRLLVDAERAGCTVIPGIEMFLNQAAVQFKLWTGQEAPRQVMREVLEKHFK